MSGDEHGGGDRPPRNIHALLFERMAEDPEVGLDLLLFLLRRVAPEMVDELDPERPPQARAGVLSGRRGRELRPDAVYVAWLRGCEQGFQVLVEQKSWPDPTAAAQLHWYVGGLWVRDLGHGVPWAALKSTLTATLYTGLREWSEPDPAAVELLRRLLRLAPGVAAVPPVVDLLRMNLEEVKRTAGRAWPCLLAMWLRGRGKVSEEHLAEIAEGIVNTPLGETLAEFAGEVLDADWDVLHNVKLLKGNLDEVKIVTTTAQRFEARGVTQGVSLGVAQGVSLGVAQGERQAKAATLVALARLKFGELPPERVAQARDASSEELGRWLEGLILSDTLDGVFREPD